MTLYANRYRVIKELGSGITGRVYLVKDEKLSGVERALKVLHSPLGHIKQPELESFQHEFEILKDFCHPSIAKVFDTGLLNAGPLGESKHFYIVTEFIKGKDLFEFTEKRSIEMIEDLFVQALRALNYLHSKKVIHLDIKPQNMLVVEKDGKLILKLIDFGFANFYQRKFIRSAEGDLLTAGTTPYVSPEAIKLETTSNDCIILDHRADLYSLGCTFYKVLTREVPFSGNSIGEIHDKHLYETPSPPSTLNPHIPEYFDKTLLQLMEKDPGNRYPSAQEVIKDLNILSGKSYPVEIPETNISYLPQVGKLIGRDIEFEKFKNLYADRIYLKEFEKKPYLIIKGKDGVGKTRFVEECKNYAQTHFVKTMSWKEYKSYGMAEDVPTPCLVLADGIPFDASDIESVEVFLSDLPILVIFATSQEKIPGDPHHIIELDNFNEKQVKEYITQATGLSSIPEQILDSIYKITKGNPLYLTEYLKALFEEGFLRDAQGSWDLQTLEDFGSQFNALGAASFIKKRLSKKIDSLYLNENKWQLLGMLALFGKPTLQELEELTNAEAIDEELKWLVEQGILEMNVTGHHVFSNPVYEEMILEKMDLQLKDELCDSIANYLERQGAPKEQILYYRGRSASPHAFEYLLELAHSKREETDYQEAKKNLLLLVNHPNSQTPKSLNIYYTALLELGEICIEMGKYEEAEEWLEKLIHFLEQNGPRTILYLQALEQFGLTYARRGQFEDAEKYFLNGLNLLQNIPSSKWMEVVLKNRLARNYWSSGNVKKAQDLFEEAWNIWKEQLSDDEKIKAIRSDIDLIYFDKGEYQKTVKCLEEHLFYLSKKPHLNAYPMTLYKLGRTYIRTNEINKGEEFLQKCLEIIKERKTPYWLYMVYNELGNIYVGKKDNAGAIPYYQYAFNSAQKMEEKNNAIPMAYNLASTYYILKQYNNAKKYFIYITNTLDKVKNKSPSLTRYLFISLLALSLFYRQEKNINKAKNYFEKATYLLKENDNLKKVCYQYYWQEKAAYMKYDKNLKEYELALQKIEQTKKTPEFQQDDYDIWLKTI